MYDQFFARNGRITERFRGALAGLAAALLFASASNAAPRRRVPRAIPARPATELSSVPAAKGAWTGWRGNPEHSGFQGLPGKISVPGIRWRYGLGGKLDPSQALLCSKAPDRANDLLVVAPPGRLAGYHLDGSPVWEQRTTVGLTLLGCSDLAGDGRLRILAGSSGLSGGKLHVFDAERGQRTWSSPSGPGSVGTIKLGPVEDSGRAVYWMPAASSTPYAFWFSRGVDVPQLLWRADLQEFVSDPYSSSSIAISETPGTPRKIVISGARGAVPTIILDGATGAELSRAQFFADGAGHGFESGGSGQLLQVGADATLGPQVLTVSSYPSGSSYMFQGITVTYPLRPDQNRSLDTYPFGLRYVGGSLRDFDGDGRTDILVSRFVVERGRHELVLYDAASLLEKAVLPDVALAGVVEGVDGPLILGFSGAAAEEVPGSGRVVSYRFRSGQFEPAGFQLDSALLAYPKTRDFDTPVADNTGSAVVVSGPADSPLILTMRDRDLDGKPDALVLSDLATGQAAASFEVGAGIRLDFLAVRPAGSASEERLVAVSDDGALLFLDGRLQLLRRVPVGGYYRNPALNGHAYEVAAVGPTVAPNANDVLVIDSRSRVLRLSGLPPASTPGQPTASVLWENGIGQELLLVPRGPLDRVAVRGRSEGAASLFLLDGSGAEMWRHPFESAGASTALPLGMNVGRFGSGSGGDVVVSIGAPGVYPTGTCAIDGGSGATLWCSSVGAFWDAAPAVWDFNRDGTDDLVMNFNNLKSILLDGASGEPWGEPAVLPQWGDLGWVDYNGAPSVAGVDPSGAVRIVNSGDNAHLALISCRVPVQPDLTEVAAVWSVPQSKPDDQRYSMAAVAPVGSDGADWVIGVGAASGLLQARRGSDGSLLWERPLWNGQAVFAGGENALSSVLALDVDGDGRVEFVVGGADGWLYAVDAASGTLRWSLDLGAPVGEPIAGDFQNEGASSILVPAADGFLYAIGPASASPPGN